MAPLWTLPEGLPKDLPAALLIVTRIPAHSKSILDQLLAMRSFLPVKAVDDGEPSSAGCVYAPRADHHSMVDARVVRRRVRSA